MQISQTIIDFLLRNQFEEAICFPFYFKQLQKPQKYVVFYPKDLLWNQPVAAKPPEKRIEISNLKILVAEDNSMNQQVIKKMLALLGYQHVTVVENGKEAIDAVKATEFDLILMDIMVNKVGG